MQDNQTWPPRPDIPEPLTEYDEFLAGRVSAPVSRQPLSRPSLIRDLRKERAEICGST